MMKGKQKLYFLLNKIDDARVITPTGQLTALHPVDNLKNKYSKVDLLQLLTKLEKDEKVIKILKVPNTGVNNFFDPYAGYTDKEDGCFYIDILPAFDEYFLKIQKEPEYQEFTGNNPPAPVRTNLSRKSLEKIWDVLQEIEDKRGITPSHDEIHIQQLHWSKTKTEKEAQDASNERRIILKKLENDDNAVKDVSFPNNLHESISLKIGDKYFEVFDYYEKEYKEAAKNYQQEQQSQQALRPTFFPRNTNQPIRRTSPRDIVNEFSSQNYSFVLMVLKQIALLAEFSIKDEINYQLQSPHGQPLIQERALLKKFQAKGLFRNLGEDGIFGIATLSDINIELIKQIIAEMEMKASGVIYQEEFEEIKAKNKYEKLVEEIRKPSQPSLGERYDSHLKDMKPKQQKNNRHKPLKKPQVVKKQPTCEWSDDFKWQGKSFVFGKHGTVNFNSKPRIALFRELTQARGGWITVQKLKEITAEDENYVRPTIGQIERGMKKELRKHISIPSTEEDDLQPKPSQGAYRIKFTPKSL